MAEPQQSAPFAPGDHLRVRRHELYYHHGIYVADERVVQFGGGIWDKPHARIEEVSLDCFLRDGTAEVVDHNNLTWVALWRLPPALPPDRIVARARCLASMPSERTYNLVGRNCETVALWCVCGMGESLQRQRFQLPWSQLGGVVTINLSLLSRRQGGFTRRQHVLIWSWLALRFALLSSNQLDIGRLGVLGLPS
jgi:Lecithin retinol acyltransferase